MRESTLPLSSTMPTAILVPPISTAPIMNTPVGSISPLPVSCASCACRRDSPYIRQLLVTLHMGDVADPAISNPLLGVRQCSDTLVLQSDLHNLVQALCYV